MLRSGSKLAYGYDGAGGLNLYLGGIWAASGRQAVGDRGCWPPVGGAGLNRLRE